MLPEVRYVNRYVIPVRGESVVTVAESLRHDDCIEIIYIENSLRPRFKDVIKEELHLPKKTALGILFALHQIFEIDLEREDLSKIEKTANKR